MKLRRAGLMVDEFFHKSINAHGISSELFSGKIRFCADYLLGGYEKTTSEVREFLSKVARENGVVFDTTYSGKALWGMKQELEKSSFSGNALFWHTGGLMNFLAGAN